MFSAENSLLPSFKSLDHTKLMVSKDIDAFIAYFINENCIDLEEVEINDFLKLIKKSNPLLINKFIVDGINYYFSHPSVLATIQDGNSTLFPNYRSINDIDYDLLIPVLDLE